MQRDSNLFYKLAFLHTNMSICKKDMQNSIFILNIVLRNHQQFRNSEHFTNYKKFVMKVTIKQINEYLEEEGMVDNSNINYLMEEVR